MTEDLPNYESMIRSKFKELQCIRLNSEFYILISAIMHESRISDKIFYLTTWGKAAVQR